MNDGMLRVRTSCISCHFFKDADTEALLGSDI
jgi:hypothetical protein